MKEYQATTSADILQDSVPKRRHGQGKQGRAVATHCIGGRGRSSGCSRGGGGRRCRGCRGCRGCRRDSRHSWHRGSRRSWGCRRGRSRSHSRSACCLANTGLQRCDEEWLVIRIGRASKPTKVVDWVEDTSENSSAVVTRDRTSVRVGQHGNERIRQDFRGELLEGN